MTSASWITDFADSRPSDRQSLIPKLRNRSVAAELAGKDRPLKQSSQDRFAISCLIRGAGQRVVYPKTSYPTLTSGAYPLSSVFVLPLFLKKMVILSPSTPVTVPEPKVL